MEGSGWYLCEAPSDSVVAARKEKAKDGWKVKLPGDKMVAKVFLSRPEKAPGIAVSLFLLIYR